jgi:hypothetical protein
MHLWFVETPCDFPWEARGPERLLIYCLAPASSAAFHILVSAKEVIVLWCVSSKAGAFHLQAEVLFIISCWPVLMKMAGYTSIWLFLCVRVWCRSRECKFTHSLPGVRSLCTLCALISYLSNEGAVLSQRFPNPAGCRNRERGKHTHTKTHTHIHAGPYHRLLAEPQGK